MIFYKIFTSLLVHNIHRSYVMLIDNAEDESFAVYSDLFSDTSLEVGKTLSKEEREEKNLNDEKV